MCKHITCRHFRKWLLTRKDPFFTIFATLSRIHCLCSIKVQLISETTVSTRSLGLETPDIAELYFTKLILHLHYPNIDENMNVFLVQI